MHLMFISKEKNLFLECPEWAFMSETALLSSDWSSNDEEWGDDKVPLGDEKHTKEDLI